MIFLNPPHFLPLNHNFQAPAVITASDKENVDTLKSRLTGYPGSALERVEFRIGDLRPWINLALAKLSDQSTKSSRLGDYALLEHLAVRYLPESHLATDIRIAYKTRFGYSPTPEINQPPDNHWAKISFDLLYKQGIFKGDKDPK